MDFINALSKSRIHIFLLRRSGAFLFDIYVPLFCLIVGVNSLSQFYATILQLAHPTICRHQKLIHCSPFCNPMQVRRGIYCVQLSKNFGANHKKNSFLKLTQQLCTHTVGHWLQLSQPSLLYDEIVWTYSIKGETRFSAKAQKTITQWNKYCLFDEFYHQTLNLILPSLRTNSESFDPTHL